MSIPRWLIPPIQIPLAEYETYHWVAFEAAEYATRQRLKSLQLVKHSSSGKLKCTDIVKY
jgi:hypothetical protein